MERTVFTPLSELKVSSVPFPNVVYGGGIDLMKIVLNPVTLVKVKVVVDNDRDHLCKCCISQILYYYISRAFQTINRTY